MTKISFFTLGCKSNQYETSRIMLEAAKRGFELADKNCPADVCIINTCTVTKLAERKSRRAIIAARRQNPFARIIVTGCYAEVQPQEIVQLKEADLLIKNADKQNILKNIGPESTAHNARAILPRIRENLMIENGCEEFCNYCIVPFARGAVKSKSESQAVSEAQDIVRSGAREIVLTGINLGAFGRDKSKSPPDPRGRPRSQAALPRLIDKLSKIDGLLRIRLSSIEPMYLTNELLEVIKTNPKVCRHLHVPLQSGSTKVLKAMGRRYSAEGFRKTIKKIKKAIPDIAINTDIIAGYPGETEKDFDQTIRFIKEMKFSRIHPFMFSPRPHTLAFTAKDRLLPSTIKERTARLHKLRPMLMGAFAKISAGKPQEILVEGRDRRSGLLEGLTGSYIRVLIKGEDRLIGKLVQVNIGEINSEFVLGEQLSDVS